MTEQPASGGRWTTAKIRVPARLRSARAQTRPDALGRLLERPLASYYMVVVPTVLLLALGLAEVLSASSVISYSQGHGSYSIAIRQVTWAALALPIAVVASRLSPKVLRALAWPLLIAVVALLVLTYTGRGYAVNGNRNWLSLGGLTLQPSEMAKPVVVMWGATVLANKERLLQSWRHLFFPFIVGSIGVLGLVLGQGDAGSGMIFVAITVGVLFFVGTPRWFFGLTLLLALAGLVGLIAQRPSRLQRVVTFTNPFAHPEGSGYQAVHSIYALATGGWWGVGLGASRQKWGLLPEANSDFIFAIIGEEMGLIGAITVLGLFTLLGYAGFRIAARADTLFVRLAAGGITVWLMSQVFINVGSVVAVLPIAGVPLPLVSAGGSSLMSTLTALGALAGFARREPGTRLYLRARQARKSRKARERASERRLEKAADFAAPSPVATNKATDAPCHFADPTQVG